MKIWNAKQRAAALVLVGAVGLASAPVALAQTAEAPSGAMGWVTFIGGMLLGVVMVVLPRVAPLTKTTVDDDVVRWLKDNRQTIDRWLDPQSESVPPTPSNPDGRA